MRTLFLVLLAVCPTSAGAASSDEPQQQAVPIGSMSPPGIGAPYFWSGATSGVGWRSDSDGSTLSFQGRGLPLGLTYKKPLRDTECVRYSLQVGSASGVRWEWYLGHGLAMDAWVVLPVSRSGLCLRWYLAEHLCVELDPGQGVSLRMGLGGLERLLFSAAVSCGRR
jgi:hypothetical protein